MKIYSTFTSEKASKSQGGNKSLAFNIKVGDQYDPQTILYGIVECESTPEADIFRLWNADILVDTITIPKGKQEKV